MTKNMSIRTIAGSLLLVSSLISCSYNTAIPVAPGTIQVPEPQTLTSFETSDRYEIKIIASGEHWNQSVGVERLRIELLDKTTGKLVREEFELDIYFHTDFNHVFEILSIGLNDSGLILDGTLVVNRTQAVRSSSRSATFGLQGQFLLRRFNENILKFNIDHIQ